jgi:hypothetical protein
LQVPLETTFPTRLGRRIGGAGRVYSFGISGAPLSQYLVWAEHARTTYRPDVMAVSIVSNDFDESIHAFKMESDAGAAKSFHYFGAEERGFPLILVEHHPTLASKLARQSALVRYLYLNCSLRADADLFMRLGLASRPDGAPAGISEREALMRRLFPRAELDPMPERARLSLKAIDLFLEQLPGRAGLPPQRIILTIDAQRIAMLAPELAHKTRTSLFAQMKAHLIARASALGFEVVDLEAPMRAFKATTGRPVELSDDYHWNPDGHAIVADAIAGTAAFRAVFPVAQAQSAR